MKNGRYDEYVRVVYYKDDVVHREDGPALESVNGYKEWYFDGKLHREDGPAVEGADGDREWYRNGVCHRVDGPAVERINGYQAWYQNGLKHRLDGPAVIRADKSEIWYRDGKKHRTFGPAEKIIRYARLFGHHSVSENTVYTWWWDGVQIPSSVWSTLGMKKPPLSITEEEAVLLGLVL